MGGGFEKGGGGGGGGGGRMGQQGFKSGGIKYRITIIVSDGRRAAHLSNRGIAASV